MEIYPNWVRGMICNPLTRRLCAMIKRQCSNRLPINDPSSQQRSLNPILYRFSLSPSNSLRSSPPPDLRPELPLLHSHRHNKGRFLNQGEDDLCNLNPVPRFRDSKIGDAHNQRRRWGRGLKEVGGGVALPGVRDHQFIHRTERGL